MYSFLLIITNSIINTFLEIINQKKKKKYSKYKVHCTFIQNIIFLRNIQTYLAIGFIGVFG